MGWNPVSAHTNFIAIHAVLLPTRPRGEILYFGGQSVGVEIPGGVLRVGIHDVETPATPEDVEVDPTVSPTCNLFCAGHCRLADGRLVIAGGTLGWPSHAGVHGEHYNGERCAWIYVPGDDVFVEVNPMQFQPGSSSNGGGRWYPSMLTLSTGETFIAGGHPDVTDNYAPPPDNTLRHNNNTPEIYSATTDAWRYVKDSNGNIPTTHENVIIQNNEPTFTENYPRLHLTREGHVFFATTNRGKNRILDPYTGEFESFDIAVPPEGMYQFGSNGSSVALPLLPADAYGLHVLVTGAETPRRVDIHGPNPQWYEAAEPNHTRVDAWNGTPPIRHHSLAVLLPNGKVFVCGGCSVDGENIDRDNSSVLAAELYDPGIDWSLGTYDGSRGRWEKLEDASIKRHYHSTALLLPNGNIWTGGSNRDGTAGETAVEIYAPDYGSGRPSIDAAPAELGYGHAFLIETPQSESIERVALMRCGSVTHAYDSDQLYVGLNFQQAEAGFLEAYSPPHAGIAPPGDYMLFVIDDQNRPCGLAKFVRLTAERCYFQIDLATFSQVDVLSFGTAEARFAGAFRVVLEGFLPDQTPVPLVELLGAGGSAIPTDQVVLQLMAIQPEGDPQSKLIAQRISFTYDVIFKNTNVFANVPDTGQAITARATHGALSCSAGLMLTKTPNPFMRDLGEGNPPWLSIDLRAFRAAEGEDPYAGITHPSGASAPFDYLAQLRAAFNSTPDGESHPFRTISEDQEENRLAVFDENAQGKKVYNYAIAKVRFRAPVSTDAADVRLIFRLFTTITPGLQYLPEIYHLSGTPGPDVKPLLGLADGEIVTIPFFAEERTAKLIDQTDSKNVQTLVGQGNQEVVHYFGCYLDLNRPNEPRFPLNPTDHTGEAGGDPLPIVQLMRGLHQCLVAEIHYPLDSIPPGATPGSHDNLAQRNLLFDKTDNPGGFASHLVHHTFQLKPSPHPLPVASASLIPTSTAAGRLLPDEFILEWGKLPRDSYATLYLPDIDIDAVLKAVGLRNGPPNLSRVDDHTLRCKITPLTYIPIPGPRQSRIPGLVSIQLPPNLNPGQRYRIIGRQVSGGMFQKVIGTFEFNVQVSTAALILPVAERKLSLLKYIGQAIPAGNRWYPVFVRWLAQLGDRIRAFGGDPDAIEPSPSGSGRRPKPGPRPSPEPGDMAELQRDEGVVRHILYDCFGKFEGFVLDTCSTERTFHSCEPAIEKLVRESCRDRTRLIVHSHPSQLTRPVRIIWACC